MKGEKEEKQEMIGVEYMVVTRVYSTYNMYIYKKPL